MSSLNSTPVEAPAGPRPGQFTAMISSTALDLPLHREVAHRACLEAGVFPIGMEQLPARDATGVAASLEMVDSADIYIGVYAFRYGWAPDGRGVSITEMEFDRALARKGEGKLREILVFTAHADHPFDARDFEADGAAREKLRRFKERAAEGRVRKEFRSAEELHRLVLHALHEFKERQRLAAGVGARPAQPTVPNNLPRLQSFFGREAELAQIREALDPGNRAWGVLIIGPGGMGKTSLAVRAAYDCAHERFDRVVFVSVKNRELDDDGVRELGVFVLPGLLEMLNELSRELGRADITKAPEGERIRLLHEALRDARALLVLDNLESLPRPDRDRLLTFVRRLPQGCKAILTSRERFGNVGDGLELERLGRDAALGVFDDLAKRSKQLARTSESERVTLYEQTAGNPLLLRWVAGQLGRGSRRTFKDALEFLRSCPEENDPLEFVFGDLADDFAGDETEVLCALTYFSLPARVEHVAAVAGHDRERVEDALGLLANRSIVVPDGEETAFELVPMVADFLRRREAAAVEAAGGRLDEQAYALVVENGYAKFDNFPLIEAAWPLVAAALPRFLAGPNERLQTVCDAFYKFLNFTGRWDEWLALLFDAEARAVAAGDLLHAGRRANDAGWVHYMREQAAEVLACAARAEAHLRAAGAGDKELAAAIRLRGEGLGLTGDYPAAIAAHREAVELWRGVNPEDVSVSSGLNGLAVAERRSGDLDAAERDFREGLRIARAGGYREGVVVHTCNLADLALTREDWPGAEALAREAMPLTEELGRMDALAGSSHTLALALARQGRKPEALPHARLAVEIYAALRSPELERASLTLAECES